MNGDLHFALTAMMTPNGAHGINYDCVPVNVADGNFAVAGRAARQRTGLYDVATNPCGDVVESGEGRVAVAGTFGSAAAATPVYEQPNAHLPSVDKPGKKSVKGWLKRIIHQEGVVTQHPDDGDELSEGDVGGGAGGGGRRRSAYAAEPGGGGGGGALRGGAKSKRKGKYSRARRGPKAVRSNV
jgi:hypothetical protein